jgi:hypothetical protein
MIMKHIKLFSVVVLAGLIIAGCKKKNEEEENEEELITTVKVTLTPISGGAAATYTWKDVDGPGGNAPTIDQITLAPSTAYNCSLQFLDESKTPAEDITAEIVAEANDHQVYYEPTTVQVGVAGLNNDGAGLPLGTTSVWGAGSVSNGTVKITLKHKPGQKASGDLVTKGETDIEVTFPTRIQ